MIDDNLGKALLRADADSPSVAEETTRLLLDRERRRIRNLAWATALLWISALAGISAAICGYVLIVAPKLRFILLFDPGSAPGEEAQRKLMLDGYILLDKILMWSLVGSLVLLAVAALFTVRLILTSRRATLRQINSNLLEISEQLKELRRTEPRP